MLDEIVIYQPWGGLGDNMAHTTLPILCKELGIKCYISRQNAYRGSGIQEFVWDKNPYIAGYKDGTDLTWSENLYKVEEKGMNHIEAIQKYYNFPIKYHYPIVYYTPKKIKELENKTVIDLTAYSIGKDYNPQILSQKIKSLQPPSDTISIIHSNITYGTRYDTNYQTYDVTNLEHYSDVFYSCKRFITLHSGQACLASTIKHQTGVDLEIFVLTIDRYMPLNNVGYTFKNTTYLSCS
jgi:hypothetical protein